MFFFNSHGIAVDIQLQSYVSLITKFLQSCAPKGLKCCYRSEQ
jgi:hypothetical protein